MKKIIIFIVGMMLVTSIGISLKNNYDGNNLSKQWNLMSMPYNETLSKEDLIIVYRGEEYNWSNAVDAEIIVDYISGWDRDSQTYYITDCFEPGYGYWMYCYEECILKRYIPSVLKLYERWLVEDGYANIKGEIVWGQQFTVGVTGDNEDFKLTSILVKLRKDKETEPGTVFLDVYDVDASGFPDNHLSAGEIDGNNVSSNFSGREVNVTMTGVKLQKDTMYAFIVTAPYAERPIHMRCVCDDEEEPNDLYDGGLALISRDNGTSWTLRNCSFYFKIYGMNV